VVRRILVACSCVLLACSDDAPPAATEPPCDPQPRSANDDFARERDPSSARVALALEVARGYIATHPAEEALWDWGDGVLMLGMADLHRVTGDAEVHAYYQRWIDYWIAAGYRHLIVASDRCPPALSALALYRESCAGGYRDVVSATLTYLYDEALRNAEGGINHLGTNNLFGISLWLDSLFMFGSVLNRWGAHAGDARALDEFRFQFTLFSGHLQDAGGLMRHAHDWALAEQDPEVYWARGNAWVTAAGYEHVAARRERGESDAAIEGILERQVDAVVALQDEASGLWWTVLNRPGETYLETSGSALFALGLARGYRAGFLDATLLPVIEAAMAGVESRIVMRDGRPVVTGISGPTMVGGFDDYAAIEEVDDLHYGVGAVILALVETSGL
jgi:unsaturated rhamnogalacturonyl hydrolase